MAKIPEKMRWIYDLLLTAAILAMATVLCTLLRRIDDGSGYAVMDNSRNDLYATPELLEAEQYLFSMMDRKQETWNPDRNQVRDLVDRYSRNMKMEEGHGMAEDQADAAVELLAGNDMIMALTGPAGTGKTTTVNAILQLLENEAERVALCAPTGRAAKRLSELTGRKASTIHRLLEVDYTGGVVSFIHNDKNLLKCDVVILDEMSMVDVKMFQALIAALRYSCLP